MRCSMSDTPVRSRGRLAALGGHGFEADLAEWQAVFAPGCA
jgi:hypothetical protein